MNDGLHRLCLVTLFLVNEIFSDYDLSLICTSQCDDDYLQCVSSCSDNNCLLDCNRAAVACSECKFNCYYDNGRF